jgi:DNA-binding transcriptional LysR family regulator
MRIEDIEYVIAVARAGGIGRAAVALGVSQPALSKALARLEADLKTRLFERHARGVRLSDEGRIFIEHGQRAAMHAADARAALRDRRQGSSGLVRLGIGAGVPSELVTDACVDATRQGQVRFLVSSGMTDSLLAQLRAAELDVILSGIPDPEDEELKWTPLWSDPMVPFLPREHPLASTPAQWTLRNFAQQAWVLPTSGTVARSRFDSAFISGGLRPPQPLVESRASGKEGELALALGAAVLLPLSLLRDPRVAPHFVCVRSLAPLRLERTVSLLSRRLGYTSPVVQRFTQRIEAARARWAMAERTSAAAQAKVATADNGSASRSRSRVGAGKTR